MSFMVLKTKKQRQELFQRVESLRAQLQAAEQERDQWKAKFTERSDEYLASIRKERQLQERVSALRQERDAMREALTQLTQKWLKKVKPAEMAGDWSTADEAKKCAGDIAAILAAEPPK